MNIEELINFRRVRILSDTDQAIEIEYGGDRETIMHDSGSYFISGGGDCSIQLQQKLELSLTQLVTNEGIFQEISVLPEFKEVMIFHELREREYKRFGIDNAHDRAVNDEILYVMKFLEPDLRQRYLEFAEQYRQGEYRDQNENRACNSHWWGEAYKILPNKHGINLIVEMFNGRRDKLCPRIIELGYNSGDYGMCHSGKRYRFWLDTALEEVSIHNSWRGIEEAHILLCVDSEESLTKDYLPNVTLVDARDKSNFALDRYFRWYEKNILDRVMDKT